MKDALQYLLKKVSFDYQRDMLLSLQNQVDKQSVEYLETMKDVLCNLYVFNKGEGGLIKPIVAYYDIPLVERDNSVTWPFIQDILLLKTLLEEHPESKQKLVELIVNYGDDEFLIKKRFERIKSGYLVKIAQDQYKKSNRKDVNFHYYLGINLLLKLIQVNLYQYYGRMDQFSVNSEVQKLIDYLHSIVAEISSVSGE